MIRLVTKRQPTYHELERLIRSEGSADHRADRPFGSPGLGLRRAFHCQSSIPIIAAETPAGRMAAVDLGVSQRKNEVRIEIGIEANSSAGDEVFTGCNQGFQERRA